MGTTRAGNISPDSETAFNFDRLMHRIFDATQTNDGTFMSAESNRASNEQEKWSIEGVEKEKKEESEKTAALVELGESQREAREEAERARIKAWDEAPSLDYPGLTNAQVLSGLRTICANLPAYTNRAVQNGWIKPEEEDEFAAYMRRELWLKEQQRLGHTNTPEYIAAQHQQDQANQQHPGWHDHAVTLNKEANGLNIDIAQDQTHSEVTAAKVDNVATNASIELFNGVESTAGTIQPNAHIHGAKVNTAGEELVTQNIVAGGIKTSVDIGADFKVAVAGNGALNPNIELNPQITNRPVASSTDFRMNDML